MNEKQFIAALYQAGWRDTCDAQHEGIKKLWNELSVSAPELDTTDHDIHVSRAVEAWDGKWPKVLTSGVLFYEGARITRAEFMKVAQELKG